jgi:hypothetical protein
LEPSSINSEKAAFVMPMFAFFGYRKSVSRQKYGKKLVKVSPLKDKNGNSVMPKRRRNNANLRGDQDL